MLADLPAGFDSTSTTHYLICYNTSRGYAQWCGALFNALLGVHEFLKNRGFKLHDPAMPLVVVIIPTKKRISIIKATNWGTTHAHRRLL